MNAFKAIAARGDSFGFASSAVELPGVGPVVRICNIGPCPISVLLGFSNAVTAQGAGLAVPAGGVEWLAREDATHIAGVALGGPSNASMVNIATGEIS